MRRRPEGGRGRKKGKTMQRFTATIASLVMLLGVANYAAAKGGLPPVQPVGGCGKSINLTASPAGTLIGASGKARVRASLNAGFLNQDFVVEMAAVVPDGTTFMVFANGLPASTITMVLGHGRLAAANPPTTYDVLAVLDPCSCILHV